MSKFKRLLLEERYQISTLRKEVFAISDIAKTFYGKSEYGYWGVKTGIQQSKAIDPQPAIDKLMGRLG